MVDIQDVSSHSGWEFPEFIKGAPLGATPWGMTWTSTGTSTTNQQCDQHIEVVSCNINHIKKKTFFFLNIYVYIYIIIIQKSNMYKKKIIEIRYIELLVK